MKWVQEEKKKKNNTFTTSVVLTVHFDFNIPTVTSHKDLPKSPLISAPGHTPLLSVIVSLKRFGSLLFRLHLMFLLCAVLNIIDSYGLKTVYATLMPAFVPNKQAAPNMKT